MNKSLLKFFAPVLAVIVMAACGAENPVLPEATTPQVITPTFQEEAGPNCTHEGTVCTDIGAGGHWSGCDTHTESEDSIVVSYYPYVTLPNKVHNMNWAAYHCAGWAPNA